MTTKILVVYKRPSTIIKAMNVILTNLCKQELTRYRLMEIKILHSFTEVSQAQAGSKND